MASPPPLQGLPTSGTVYASVAVMGYSALAFGTREQAAFRVAVGEISGVASGSVIITGVASQDDPLAAAGLLVAGRHRRSLSAATALVSPPPMMSAGVSPTGVLIVSFNVSSSNITRTVELIMVRPSSSTISSSNPPPMASSGSSLMMTPFSSFVALPPGHHHRKCRRQRPLKKIYYQLHSSNFDPDSHSTLLLPQ